jgi:hypothetical protein
MRFGLNFIPIIAAALFAWWFALIAMGWGDAALFLASSGGIVVVVVELVGRRPSLVQMNGDLRIRNLLSSTTVSRRSVVDVGLGTMPLGKDHCPALRMKERGRALKVYAYFGDAAALREDLNV